MSREMPLYDMIVQRAERSEGGIRGVEWRDEDKCLHEVAGFNGMMRLSVQQLEKNWERLKLARDISASKTFSLRPHRDRK